MKYSMTQLSMKQNIFDSHVKRLKKLNAMMAEMCVLDMDEEVLSAIEDICKDVIKCSNSINEAAEEIKSYAFMANMELKSNEAVQPDEKFPAIDIDGDEGEYVLADKTVNRGAL